MQRVRSMSHATDRSSRQRCAPPRPKGVHGSPSPADEKPVPAPSDGQAACAASPQLEQSADELGDVDDGNGMLAHRFLVGVAQLRMALAHDLALALDGQFLGDRVFLVQRAALECRLVLHEGGDDQQPGGNRLEHVVHHFRRRRLLGRRLGNQIGEACAFLAVGVARGTADDLHHFVRPCVAASGRVWLRLARPANTASSALVDSSAAR